MKANTRQIDVSNHGWWRYTEVKAEKTTSVFILCGAQWGIWLQVWQQTLVFNFCLNEIQTQLSSNFSELGTCHIELLIVLRSFLLYFQHLLVQTHECVLETAS